MFFIFYNNYINVIFNFLFIKRNYKQKSVFWYRDRNIDPKNNDYHIKFENYAIAHH